LSDQTPNNQGYCFTTVYNGFSRTLKNYVEIESAINPNERLQFTALWDTGAYCSLIRPEVVQKLKLLPVSITKINTPSSKNEPSSVYMINLYLPNKVRVANVQVLEGIPSGCDMLVGMDIIGLGDFAVTNFNNHTVFSFRMPSMTTIDFVHHSYLTSVENANKVGRNDPCPCGSGKKYKHCHGK
jgi:predicted aspartyl protease